MLVEMLTGRLAGGGTYNLTFGESIVMSGIGMFVVLLELVLIAAVVLIMGKVVGSLAARPGKGKKGAAPAKAPAVRPAAPGAARALVAGYNVLKPVLSLFGVDDPTAAMVMAVTADRMGAKPSELSFRAIRAIDLPKELNGVDPKVAAEVVSKCASDNGFTLDTVTVRSLKAVE